MRLLLDVNVGSRIAAALVAVGHDVARAVQGDATAEDPVLLAKAEAERRILVTYDRDFSELVFARGGPRPPGVIYLRFRARDVASAVAHLLSTLDKPVIEGHMTVIDERRVRHAPLPDRSGHHG